MTPSNIKDVEVSPGCCLAKITTVFAVDGLSAIDEFNAEVEPWEFVRLIVLCLEVDL